MQLTFESKRKKNKKQQHFEIAQNKLCFLVNFQYYGTESILAFGHRLNFILDFHCDHNRKKNLQFN